MSAVNKIVVVGAGSATFGTNTLSALLRSEPLRGSHLALVDTDPFTLKMVASLADRLNKEWNAQFTVSSHLNHKDGVALQGARFVVCSIEVGPREELWESDYSIPLKYGVRQPYAENGGPAGFAHAARNISAIMDIVKDMEKICPNALFINYTNPMIRICDAVNRHSKIKCVGLCHQIYAAYGMIGVALSKELGINIPPELQGMHAAKDQHLSHKLLKEQTLSRINVRAAGLNHLTWVLSVHEQKSGKDLYPLLRERFFNSILHSNLLLEKSSRCFHSFRVLATLIYANTYLGSAILLLGHMNVIQFDFTIGNRWLKTVKFNVCG